jgi:hypothetical protein
LPPAVKDESLCIQVSQNWRTNYVLTNLSRMFKFTLKKYGKKNSDKKTKKKSIIQLTIIQCKQRYIRPSLPCNVAVVDLR